MPVPIPGYSGTSVARKLGITPEARILLIDAPEEYASWLEPIPEGVTFVKRVGKETALAHLFVKERIQLEKHLKRLRSRLPDHASIWVSWPKKASKVSTDISEDVIRQIALPMGYVDIKVCAVSDVWSGLKIVVRKELRKS